MFHNSAFSTGASAQNYKNMPILILGPIIDIQSKLNFFQSPFKLEPFM